MAVSNGLTRPAELEHITPEYCPGCGAELREVCGRCGKELWRRWKDNHRCMVADLEELQKMDK